MPLPEKRSHEKDQDFISRCMGDEVMRKEFPDQKQRSAVCYSQLRKSKKKKAMIESLKKELNNDMS